MGNNSSLLGEKQRYNILLLGLEGSGKTALFNRIMAENASLVDQIVLGASVRGGGSSSSKTNNTGNSGADDFNNNNNGASPNSPNTEKGGAYGFPAAHVPTPLDRTEVTTIAGRRVTLCELGGGNDLRRTGAWSRYASCGVDAIALVVDAHDRGRAYDAFEALIAALTADSFRAAFGSADVPIAVLINKLDGAPSHNKAGENSGGGGGEYGDASGGGRNTVNMRGLSSGAGQSLAGANADDGFGMALRAEEVRRLMDFDRALRPFAFAAGGLHCEAPHSMSRLGFPNAPKKGSAGSPLGGKKSKKVKRGEFEGFGDPNRDSPAYHTTAGDDGNSGGLERITTTTTTVSSSSGYYGSPSSAAGSPISVVSSTSFGSASAAAGGEGGASAEERARAAAMAVLDRRQIEFFEVSARTGANVSTAAKWLCRAAKRVEAAYACRTATAERERREAAGSVKRAVDEERRARKEMENAKRNQKPVKF